MTEPDQPPDRTLELAGRVALILEEVGAPCALIGAAALAVHGYARATADIDLAVATDPFSTLREAQRRIASCLPVEATLVTPDADDPLGGVLSVMGEGCDPIQVVNFHNPLNRSRNPGAEAVQVAVPGMVAGTTLRVVDLPHLVALKLYAGGYKSRLDVLALLERHPGIDLSETRQVCARFGLDEDLRTVLAEIE